MPQGKGMRRRRVWWTRDRVILGLQRFYADFKFCPLATCEYHERVVGTGRTPDGRPTNLGHLQKYPSFAAILKFFKTFRQAWTAAGFDVDRAWEEWTAMEDWFVLESVGILPRSEVAKILKRSAPAIKRRLYDLGDIRSYNRWGITVSHAEQLTGMSRSVICRYLDYGIIPYLRGNKLIYMNPADLLKIEEIDWSRPVNPELDSMIRAGLAQRIAKMLKFGHAWRDHEVYKFHKKAEPFTGRIKNPRTSAFAAALPEPPNDLNPGDWVTPSKPLAHMKHGAGNRIGVIKAVLYSVQNVARKDGTHRPCWVARVEFPKIRTITDEKSDRIKWTIPLDALIHAEQPVPAPKPLSMHPEAVRGRKRVKAGQLERRRQRLHERVRDEVLGQLT